jgi:hypothetical protein
VCYLAQLRALKPAKPGCQQGLRMAFGPAQITSRPELSCQTPACQFCAFCWRKKEQLSIVQLGIGVTTMYLAVLNTAHWLFLVIQGICYCV